MNKIVSNKYIQQAKKITLDHLANQEAKVFLFGSRAKDTAHRHSDIDIAFLAKNPINASILSAWQEALEESTIPYTVDIVNLSHVNEEFKAKVIHEGILWKD